MRLKRFISDMDKPLLFATVFLFIFGLLNIVTASSSEAVTSAVPLYYYFYRHLAMLGAGFVLTIIVLNVKIILDFLILQELHLFMNTQSAP